MNWNDSRVQGPRIKEDGFADVLEFLRPIQHLIDNEEVTEIMVNSDRSVWIEVVGQKAPACITLPANWLNAALVRIARADNHEPSEDNAIVNCRFGDGSSRICMVFPPVSPDGPCFSLRKFKPQLWTATDLIEREALTVEAYLILKKLVAENKNILISGGVGTGKTTLLNVLALDIPSSERILLLESPSEIRLPQPNQQRLQADEQYGFGQLIKDAALRLSSDRLIMGEVRGEEAHDLLRALNLGMRGSFATIHADHADEALFTLASLASSAKPNLRPDFIRQQTGKAIHVVVHVIRSGSGRRFVSEILAVNGYDDASGIFVTNCLYKSEGGQRNLPREVS